MSETRDSDIVGGDADDDGFATAHVSGVPAAGARDTEPGVATGDSTSDFLVAHVAEGEQKSAAGTVAPPAGPGDAPVSADLPAYEAPSLEKAREFFHDSLPHRIRDTTQPSGFRLARPGEKFDHLSGKAAERYNFFTNKLEHFDEFGIGISLYFRQLLVLATLLFVCGLCSLPAINANRDFNPDNTPGAIEGSVLGAQRDDLSLADQGASDIVVCILLAFFAILSYAVESAAVERIDVAQQTPQDYAVSITNPAPTLEEPEQYFDFFSQFGDVVFITVCKDNGKLLRALAKKRILKHALANKRAKLERRRAGSRSREDERDVDEPLTQEDLKPWQLALQPFGAFQTIEYLEDTLATLKTQIEGLSHLPAIPKRVFALYDTEHAQRTFLKETATSYWELYTNVSTNEKAQLHNRVLNTEEPVEPSEVIWENFDVGWREYFRRMTLSYFVSAVVLVASYYILAALYGQQGAAALFVSLLNLGLPQVIKQITMRIERHRDFSSVQQSIMTKLVLARCLNTAILLYLVTPYEKTFSKENLEQVQAILIADAVTSPIVRFLDVPSSIKRWILARNAPTQFHMNLLWQGTPWFLAERYTDLVKTVFVGLFFSPLLPSGLFISAFACLSSYCCDKYALYNLWQTVPMVDESLATQSRYYLIGVVWTHLVLARIFFANWPYQNVNDKASCGLFTCTDPENVWTTDQKEVVQVFAVFGIIAAVGAGVGTIGGAYAGVFLRLFKPTTKEVGEATNISYRSLPGITAYIPLIRLKQLIDPLIAADISLIPRSFIPVRTADDVDPDSLCLAKPEEFPNEISEHNIKQLFSAVQFFPDTNYENAPAQQQQPQGVFAPMMGAAAFLMQNAQQMAVNAAASIQYAPTQLQQQNVTATAAPLPAGWEERVDPNSGRTYYICHATKSSTWERPAFGTQTNNRPGLHHMSSGMSFRGSLSSDSIGDLPPGWERRIDTRSGRPYWVNHRTRTTQWEHPGM